MIPAKVALALFISIPAATCGIAAGSAALLAGLSPSSAAKAAAITAVSAAFSMATATMIAFWPDERYGTQTEDLIRYYNLKITHPN